MKPILYNSTETAFSSYGVGVLVDALSCYVDESENGPYELTMKYPVTGAFYSSIRLHSIILARPNFSDRPQPFDVQRITKPINGVVTVYAQHWSYRLSGIPVTPFVASSLPAALAGLTANAMAPCIFEFSTTRSTVAQFKADAPTSIRSWMGGKEGSLLDVYGGVYHFDRELITLENRRGENRGFQIRYGRNMTNLEQEENCSAVYTGVLAYWQKDDACVYGTIQNAPGTYNFTRVLSLDVSGDFEEQPTTDQLNARAEAYITANKVGVPKVNLKVGFAQLSTLGDRVDLGDIVEIYFEVLGVSASAECIKTRWDVLLDRYESCEFGDPRNNIAATLATVESTQVTLEAGLANVDKATRDIWAALGSSYVIYEGNRILIVDRLPKEDARDVILIDAGGIGFGQEGINGTFKTAWTIDGTLNMENIHVVGTISANLIRGGVLQLGGVNNTNGKIEILDASNSPIGEISRDGVKMNGQDGSTVVMNTVDGFAGYDRNGVKIYWADYDQFHMRKSVVEEEITLCQKVRFIPIEITEAGELVNDGIGMVAFEEGE